MKWFNGKSFETKKGGMCNYLMEKCEQQTFSSYIYICVNENERKNFFYVRQGKWKHGRRLKIFSQKQQTMASRQNENWNSCNVTLTTSKYASWSCRRLLLISLFRESDDILLYYNTIEKGPPGSWQKTFSELNQRHFSRSRRLEIKFISMNRGCLIF